MRTAGQPDDCANTAFCCHQRAYYCARGGHAHNGRSRTDERTRTHRCSYDRTSHWRPWQTGWDP